jgi:hypothetical protein
MVSDRGGELVFVMEGGAFGGIGGGEVAEEGSVAGDSKAATGEVGAVGQLGETEIGGGEGVFVEGGWAKGKECVAAAGDADGVEGDDGFGGGRDEGRGGGEEGEGVGS